MKPFERVHRTSRIAALFTVTALVAVGTVQQVNAHTAAPSSTALSLTAPPSSPPPPPPTSPPTSGPPPNGYPIFRVTQEGLVQSQGAALSQAYGIPNALASNGAFTYADAVRFAQVPQNTVGTGTDKQGRPTTSQALNTAALGQIVVLSDSVAISRSQQLIALANLGPLFTTAPTVSHNSLILADKSGRTTNTYALDTTVSYQIALASLPVTGQGSRLRVTFAPDGTVTQLSDSQRAITQIGTAPVIPASQAAAECSALYGPSVTQAPPTLDYEFPALTAQQANGHGTVTMLFPQYTCNPMGPQGPQAGRLVPAVLGTSPSAMVTATRSGDSITASVSGLTGGTAPYSYQWSSSTTLLSSSQTGGPSTSYTRTPRTSANTDELVSVQITDANGLATTAGIDLPGNGSGQAPSLPGGGGLEALATVGIEQTVNEWQCAQDSANGFRNVMAAHGVGISFDWRGPNAWEDDFEDPAFLGNDHAWVDNVDDAWYTGHGWPGGFTFKGFNDTQTITPPEISWGDHRVDWVELESCEVLQDTTGTNDYFGRWGPTLDGLHVLNGFHTVAFCIAGGTGGTFASYLFPLNFLWWNLRPAFPVQKAWAAMAVDLEPAGVVYRSMGPLGPGFVTNIGDYFWGQGPVGPDIFAANEIGYWAIAGTV